MVKCARILVSFAILMALAAVASAEKADAEVDAEAEELAYGLDDVSREVAERGKVRCPKIEMVRYRGDTIRYHKPVRVYVGFRDKLREFEKVVEETAVEVYGRKPRRIRHIGTYNCRRIRSYPTYISEHGLGNAIDVEGFDFGPAPRATRKQTPRKLRRGFKVRVEKHWNAKKGVNATHAKFLKLLAERLVEREDIFRVLLRPAYPGHQDHFHFDVSPWRIVEIF
jgi:hypothetical protein